MYLRFNHKQERLQERVSIMSARKDFLLNNQFRVAVGQDMFSFAKVSNLSDSYELETVSQGGANTCPEFLFKQKSRYETLILEKGVPNDLMKKSRITAGTRLTEVLIMVMQHRVLKKCYHFDYGIVTQWEVSPLDAVGNEILIEKLEIAHSGLKELTIKELLSHGVKLL